MDKFYENYKNTSKKILENNKILKDIKTDIAFTNSIREIINPVIEAQRIWQETLTIKNPFRKIDIDFSGIKENTRKGCEKMLSKGFYPYKNIGTSVCLSIIKLNDDIEIEKILSEDVEYQLEKSKENILSSFKKYSESIDEIYKLYYEKEYRLCILSLINILSQIFNSNFEYRDFTETNELILRDYRIMTITNEEYYQFMPYCVMHDGKTRKYDNTLLNNYIRKKDKYLAFPYNRNAILHGYSKDFGNKTNCLRWFSVLINTNDILKYNIMELK